MLHYNSGPLLWPKFRAVFVLDGASNEQLCARFRKMRDGDGDGGERLPKGIRTTCFLVADKAAIEDAAAKAPYVPRYRFHLQASLDVRPEDPMVFIRAVDPDYEAAAADVAKQAQGEVVGDDNGAEARNGSIARAAYTAETKQPAKNGADEVDGFKGEATLMLPKVFDWLHDVCFITEHESGCYGYQPA